MIPILMLSGPVGVGKTSVAYELSDQLMAREVAHAVVDLDRLAVCWPWDTVRDPFNQRLAYANLASIWPNFVDQGVDRLVISYVVEDRRAVEDSIAAAVPGARVTVCGLTADDATLAARVGKRESGSSLAKLIRRSLELSAILQADGLTDITVATDDRALSDIALEILGRTGWC